MRRPGLTVGDALLMAGLFLLALGLALAPLMAGTGGEAEIVLAETGEVRRISLAREADYPIVARGVLLTVRVSGGVVSVAESDCRDGICRNTPAISRPGQSIVCAPAGVIVRVIGEEAVVDGVAG